MSTALAIAATTRVLAQVIDDGIEAAGIDALLGPAPHVVSQAPDQLETGTSEVTQLSLFLFHVTYNQGWREVGLPTRNGAGTPVSRPPLALDLHYLLTAYGTGGYQPQILLGLGMMALHENPVLYRAQITNVFAPPPPPATLSPVDQQLATAELASQLEMIKITPEPLSTEELSKLWTALGGKFRPSAGFSATVVLIDSQGQAVSAPPVKTANIAVMPFLQPVVTTVAPQYVPWSATPATLTLTGANLTGQNLMVVFDAAPTEPRVPQPVNPGGAGGAMATVTLPTGLPAGANTLRVAGQVSVGAPPPKTAFQSSAAQFYLQPVIRQGTPGPDDDLVTAGTPTTTTPPTTPVTVQLDPALGSTQTVELLLNQLSAPAGTEPESYTFPALPTQIAGNSVTFTTSGVATGTYLVRVRVDGAESLLRPGTTGAYAYPQVAL